MAIGCYDPDDHYLRASFRGVPFDCLETTSQHGRRVAEGEFVYGEQTAFADLGRKIRHFEVHGRWADNTHAIISELFIRACEMPGAGILVHPTRGFLRVICTSLTIRDDPMESAGVTEFDAEFTEANILNSPLTGLLDVASIGAKAYMLVASGDFEDLFNNKGLGGYYKAFALGAISQAVGSIGAAYFNAAAADSSGAYPVNAQFKAYALDPTPLMNPDNAANAIENGLDFIHRDSANSGKAQAAYRSIINAMARQPNAPGAGGEQQEIVYAHTRAAAAIYLAQEILDTEPENMQSALRDYEQINTVLTEELEAARADCRNPCFYNNLSEIASKIRFLLLQRAYKAQTLQDYQLPGTTHSLVAAWEVYGDSSRGSEIYQNNGGLPWAVGADIIAS